MLSRVINGVATVSGFEDEGVAYAKTFGLALERVPPPGLSFLSRTNPQFGREQDGNVYTKAGEKPICIYTSQILHVSSASIAPGGRPSRCESASTRKNKVPPPCFYVTKCAVSFVAACATKDRRGRAFPPDLFSFSWTCTEKGHDARNRVSL